MSKKQSNEAKDYKEGVASFNAWMKNNKALEKMAPWLSLTPTEEIFLLGD